MQYYKTDSIDLTNPSNDEITQHYSQGYLFTRLAKSNLYQTRSLRIDLSKFELNSENRRILRKNEDLILEVKDLPIDNYSWEIHAMGKNFYTTRFGDGTMSAAKIKELFTELDESNMTSAMIYKLKANEKPIGYCLTYKNKDFLHYAYPFYDLELPKERSLGLAMMTKAVLWAKEQNLKYIYLGSVTDKKAHYKLQFEGLEWWEQEKSMWNIDIGHLKMVTDN